MLVRVCRNVVFVVIPFLHVVLLFLSVASFVFVFVSVNTCSLMYSAAFFMVYSSANKAVTAAIDRTDLSCFPIIITWCSTLFVC